MRAVVHDRYGPPEVLRLDEVERLVPAEDDLLVRVHATTVTRSDCANRAAHPFVGRLYTGLRRPKRRILGVEFAGTVEEAGAAVHDFAPGDRVFGASIFGAWAEYVRVRASGPVAHVPHALPLEQAAALSDGAILALNAMRSVEFRPGLRMLVYGASGSIGTAGVQLAKHFGAHVTAVCDTKHVELVRSLGADEVVDYTQEDFVGRGETYDVILDAVGKERFTRTKRVLEPGGVYLPTDGWTNFAWGLWRFGDKRVRLALPPRYTKDYVLLVKRLVEAGEYRPVIDRTYPLEEVVEASRYVETEQKTGNVVLTLDGAAR